MQRCRDTGCMSRSRHHCRYPSRRRCRCFRLLFFFTSTSLANETMRAANFPFSCRDGPLSVDSTHFLLLFYAAISATDSIFLPSELSIEYNYISSCCALCWRLKSSKGFNVARVDVAEVEPEAEILSLRDGVPTILQSSVAPFGGLNSPGSSSPPSSGSLRTSENLARSCFAIDFLGAILS